MKRLLFLSVLLCWPVVAHGAQITVCASGCTYNNSQLQSALNAANNGDEVLLQRGFQYDAPGGDSYKLGVRCTVPAWDCITLRTGVESNGTLMPRSAFPADGVRVNPAVYRGVYAKFIPTTNNVESLRTVFPGETGAGLCASTPCVGSGWTVKWLEFGPKADWMQRPFLRFGTNRYGGDLPGGIGQDTLVRVPRYMSLIQCDFHGDDFGGQFGGLYLASRETRIIGNSFRSFQNVAQQGQAITASNGTGPMLVENNYIEASGENVIWGGADTYLQLQATVTGSPSTTSIDLASPVWRHWDGSTEAATLATDMYSGIFISVTHGGLEYNGITCALSGSTCTVSPALPFTPSVGDLVKWCWLNGGITFRYNHSFKPVSWNDPIVATPTGISALGFPTGGTLSAAGGAYCYKVVAWALVAGGVVHSNASAEACATISNGTTGRVAVSWNAVPWSGLPGSITYQVLGRTAGGQNQSWDIGSPTLTYTDTGSAGAANTPQTSSDYWYVLNNFELKHCDGASPMGPCLIEYNVIDQTWCNRGQDNIVSIKVNNQDGNDMSATERNVTFRNNLIRHGCRALTLQATHTEQHVTGVMTDVTIANNLFYGLNNQWGSDGSAIIMTSGNNGNVVGSRNCIRCTIRHNTFLAESNNLHGPMLINMNAAGDKLTDFVIKDNIMSRDATEPGQVNDGVSALWAYINDVRQNPGTASWTVATQGASSADHNAWPDGNSGVYTPASFPSSFFPSQTQLQSYLVNYAACSAGGDIVNCALNGASPLDGTASDATDVGANIAAIKAGTDIALTGDTNALTTTTQSGRPRTRIRLRGGDAQ